MFGKFGNSLAAFTTPRTDTPAAIVLRTPQVHDRPRFPRFSAEPGHDLTGVTGSFISDAHIDWMSALLAISLADSGLFPLDMALATATARDVAYGPERDPGTAREVSPTEAAWLAGRTAGSYAPRAESLLLPRDKYLPPGTYDAVDLDYLIRTQDDDLATTYDVMVANKMEAISIERSRDDDSSPFDLLDDASPRTIYVTPDPHTLRLIEWERAEAQHGPLYRARPWDDHGSPVVRADVNNHAARNEEDRAVLARLARIANDHRAPTAVARAARTENAGRAAYYGPQWRLSLLTPHQLAQYTARVAVGAYLPDEDPLRVAFHADTMPEHERLLRERLDEANERLAELASEAAHRAQWGKPRLYRIWTEQQRLYRERDRLVAALADIGKAPNSPYDLSLDLTALDQPDAA